MPLLMASTCDNNEQDQIPCTMEAKAGLNVTVIDGATNIPLVEGVVVTVADGTYQETLQLFPGLEYIFTGAWERPGHYTITATKEGYQTNSSQVLVTSDVCHVIPKQLQIILNPQ